ncbi:flagellar protein FliS [Nocardioides thalensis]|uniref:Flagellar protein FliS n=1 Tax=Nocardioides thalensis TaxID=1914755 RepID=A0A853BY17_9ACTN|nr:flagellar export chaperone FliS [Nocardioides thalensis]NYI99840.1 flagellar protein FliS [Nocardioides thalensis]
MYPTNARAAYMGNSVGTASPARLLVMLVERLVLDVERGLRAQREEDWQAAHHHLTHAQDIVIELETSLDVDAMPGGHELAGLYDFLRRRLVTANVRRNAGVTQQALVIARHLCDTWRQAAMAAAR